MNKNEFYKQLMSEYMFDAEKIRENAKRSARRQKLQPMYIGMTAAAAACVVTVGTIAAVNLGGNQGVSIKDSGLTQLSAGDRVSQAIEQLRQERGSEESKDFMVTFAAPLSPADAQSVLTAYSEGSVPVKQLYLADGTKITDISSIEKIFTGNSDSQITGAAIYCSGDTAARLQSNTSVFLVESMQPGDFDNAAPINIDEVNTEEITVPNVPEYTEPVDVVVPPVTSNTTMPPAAEETKEATADSDGTEEEISETEEMDGTVEPEITTEESDPFTNESFSEEITDIIPPETTTVPDTTVSTDITVSEPEEISLPDGVTLPTDYSGETFTTYIGGDSAFFLTDDVLFVRNGSYVELYSYSPDSEKLLCSELLDEAKIIWIDENGGRMMLTGFSDYGTRGRTLLVDALSETITDLYTDDCVMTGVLSSTSYNADSNLLVMNIRENGVYYITAMKVNAGGSTEYIGTFYESSDKVCVAASDGSTVYMLVNSGSTSKLIAADVYSEETRAVMNFDEIPSISRNYAFTHAVFTMADGSVNVFDAGTERMLRLDTADTAVCFGASRHSFVNNGICYTISGGSVSSNGGISALASVEYKKSFSSLYSASASGGMVHISASIYNSLNKASMLTFSEISENAPAAFRQTIDGAIGLNNAIAAGTLQKHGMITGELVSQSLSVYYSAQTTQKILSECGINSYGALSYTNGGMNAVNPADTQLVISTVNDSTAEGVLYIKAGIFAGRLAYRSVNVDFVKESGFWKLNTIL